MKGLREHYKVTKTEHLEMTRGDTLAFGVQLTFEEGDPQPAETAFLTVKQSERGEQVFQKSLGSGIELESSEGNDYFYTVRISPRDTRKVALGDYFYALDMSMNNDTFTLLSGVLRIVAGKTA